MPSWSLSAKILIAFAAILIGFTIFDGMSGWVASHWIIGAVIIGTLALLLLIGLGIQHYFTSASRREHASLERHLAEVDKMDLPQFEAWVGKLLIRHGFTKLRCVGRSGDFGSSLVATGPDARRIMVRAKPDDRTLGNRGDRHIQALGLDAHARWQVDTAMLVTNADLHPLKTGARHDALAAQLGVIIVDRLELALWIAERQPPPELTSAASA